MIQWKLGCRSRKQKRKNQPIAKSGIKHCHWFILPLLLATPTMQFFHLIVSDGVISRRNQCSASDSVGLVFTRSYHFMLLIMTPTTTTTPSLVKTSLKDYQKQLLWYINKFSAISKQVSPTAVLWPSLFVCFFYWKRFIRLRERLFHHLWSPSKPSLLGQRSVCFNFSIFWKASQFNLRLP